MQIQVFAIYTWCIIKMNQINKEIILLEHLMCVGFYELK